MENKGVYKTFFIIFITLGLIVEFAICFFLWRKWKSRVQKPVKLYKVMHTNPTIEFTEVDLEKSYTEQRRSSLFECDAKGTPTGLKNYSFVILSNKKSYKIDTIRAVDKVWKKYDTGQGSLSKKDITKLIQNLDFYVDFYDFEFEGFIQK
jgi:hypothetical protein